jgi:flagellar biosynthesis component FlhA
LQSNDSIDELVSLAKDADHILTENARKIVLDMLHQGVKPNASDFDKILSLGRFFDNKIANQIGTAKTNQMQSDSQKSKELSEKISQCASKINQMSYNELIIVMEQQSVGGIQSATNYILNGKQILRTKKSQY